MKSIYKYDLPVTDKNTLQLPVGAEVLSLIEQNNKLVLYCLIPIYETEMEFYEVLMFGTGDKITTDLSDYTFIGTVGIHLNSVIVHAFYKKSN